MRIRGCDRPEKVIARCGSRPGRQWRGWRKPAGSRSSRSSRPSWLLRRLWPRNGELSWRKLGLPLHQNWKIPVLLAAKELADARTEGASEVALVRERAGELEGRVAVRFSSRSEGSGQQRRQRLWGWRRSWRRSARCGSRNARNSLSRRKTRSRTPRMDCAFSFSGSTSRFSRAGLVSAWSLMLSGATLKSITRRYRSRC
jgi:hypothetical protein